MGNCCIHESSVSCADDDEWWWSEDQVTKAGCRSDDTEKEESEMGKDQRMLMDGIKGGTCSTDQVKIKITKRQLQELLSEVVDGKGFPIKQALAQLMRENDRFLDEDDHGHWRPALQSIPETSE